MFGIASLKTTSCSSCKSNHLKIHKNNYCGLCKSIASRYSQKARLFLNYDVAFLQELLLAYNTEKQHLPKQPLFHCFSIPKEDELSEIERFCADVNVFLARCTVVDKIEDNEGIKWKALNEVYHGDFVAACRNLSSSGFPVDKCLQILGTQKGIESKRQSDVYEYARPAAEVCSMVYEFAANIVGLADSEEYKKLGYLFGEMVYMADALADYKSDEKQQQFNPLFMIEGNYPERIEQGRSYLKDKLKRISASIAELSFSADKQDYFISLLKANTNKFIYSNELKLDSKTEEFRSLKLQEKFSELKVKFKLTWQGLISPDFSFGDKFKGAKAFVSLLVFIFISSRLAAQADMDLHTVFASQDCCQCCDACGNCCESCSGSCEKCNECCDGCKSCCSECDGCCKECSDCSDICQECGQACGYTQNECNTCCNMCCCSVVAIVLLIVGTIVGVVLIIVRSSQSTTDYKTKNAQQYPPKDKPASDTAKNAEASDSFNSYEIDKLDSETGYEQPIEQQPETDSYYFNQIRSSVLASGLLLFVLVFYSVMKEGSPILGYTVFSSIVSVVLALLFGMVPCGLKPYKFRALTLMSVFSIVLYSFGLLYIIGKVLMN